MSRSSHLLLALLGGTLVASVSAQSLFDQIGYTTLVQEWTTLGKTIPNGAGIVIDHVEGAPNDADPRFTGITFTHHSGSEPSVHADLVGANLYGTDSMGTGITQVHSYTVAHWLQSGGLNGQLGTLPHVATGRVQNHSWIYSLGGDLNLEVLRRLDYQIKRDNTVVVAANGNGVTFELISMAHNVIAVGTSSGQHGWGGGTFSDGEGRQFTHVVVPQPTTSESTPVVAGTATMLLEHAIAQGYTDGERSEVIKAVIMSGAVTAPFENWTNSPAAPLDEMAGAGQLNVFNSLTIMDAGPQPQAIDDIGASAGWAFGAVADEGELSYRFDVLDGTTLADFAATLVWHRDVTVVDLENNLFDYTLADLDLSLFSLTTDEWLAESFSSIDNAEHIRLAELPAGAYELFVTSYSGAAEFGLAWGPNFDPNVIAFSAIPEPSTYAAFFGAFALCFATWRRRIKATAGLPF